MSEQSNIYQRGRGRPRKTQEEQTLSRQRRKVYKSARDSFRYKQVQEQRQQRLQRTHAIQQPGGEEEERVVGMEIAPPVSTSSNIFLLSHSRFKSKKDADV
jgi:AT hook motif